MKPPGGTYKPTFINVGKIPKSMSVPVPVSATGDADVSVQAISPNAAEPPVVGAINAPPDESRYTTARVMTASPAELILMMFEQFFDLIPDIKRNVARGSQAAVEPDAERAQAIVDELIGSLDFSLDISKDIGAIYIYVRNKILEANIRFDADIWDHVESVMRPLYDGFKQAAAQAGTDAEQPAISSRDPSIIAGYTYGHSSLKEVVVNTKTGLRV